MHRFARKSPKFNSHSDRKKIGSKSNCRARSIYVVEIIAYVREDWAAGRDLPLFIRTGRISQNTEDWVKIGGFSRDSSRYEGSKGRIRFRESWRRTDSTIQYASFEWTFSLRRMESGKGTNKIITDIPARMDRLPWSRFHWLVVISLGIIWILARYRLFAERNSTAGANTWIFKCGHRTYRQAVP